MHLLQADALRPNKTPYIADADRGFYEVVNNTVVDKRTNRVLMSDANDQIVAGNAFLNSMHHLQTATIYKKLVVSFQT